MVERGVLEARAGHRRDGHLEEIRRAVHRVHVLVQHAPHVAALAAQDPLHAQPLRLGVDLGVQPLDHLVRREQAEVAALRRVGAEGVVEADLVEQQQVAEQRVVVRGGEVVGRRDDEQHLGALLVDRRLDADAGDLLELVHREVDAVLEAVRLDAQVVAGAEAVGRRLDAPS